VTSVLGGSRWACGDEADVGGADWARAAAAPIPSLAPVMMTVRDIGTSFA
jgi:hypothetical protein